MVSGGDPGSEIKGSKSMRKAGWRPEELKKALAELGAREDKERRGEESFALFDPFSTSF
jgi:hypothetical protein